MVKWIGLVLMTPKTCDNHGQRDKQTEFINRVKIEQISLRTKLVISEPEKFIHSWSIFKQKKWVGD